MSRKNKFYIPLTTTIKGRFIYINAEKIPEIKKLIPTLEDIKMHIANQKARYERGKEYTPLQIKVSKEKFEELEKQIRIRKPKHVFIVKAIDIISHADAPSIVQIISI